MLHCGYLICTIVFLSPRAEKEAKKKARAKELRKLPKARQKKVQAEAAEVQTAPSESERGMLAASALKGQSHSSLSAKISKEEELRRAQNSEREKRGAAVERKLVAAAALKAQGTGSVFAPICGSATDIQCSCCNGSLAGKFPFQRYNYKYCSSAWIDAHAHLIWHGPSFALETSTYLENEKEFKGVRSGN
ncbi:hypothetical protein A4A49_52934 [Nicotiana attenuata]|uniref:Vms1-associating treble clef domain-containing protein n=1 Tax=Nicotiana attenuata TaxID=49451 RepID=A0A314KSG7_NICAT|nr:hypothetical protein A4A49_52934 [Nicotiana attenuata]